MEENKKKFDWKIAVAVITVLLLVICLFKIHDQSEQINNLQSSVSLLQHKITNIDNNISSLYTNIDEHLKKEASLLSDVDYSLGELNTNDHTIPVTIKVTPKALTDDMHLSVNIGGASVPLERNGNEFSATMPVNMFVSYDSYPMLSITSNGTTKTEKLEDVNVSALYTRYLPNVYAFLEVGDQFKNGQLILNGVLNFDEKPSVSDSDVSVVKLVLVTEKNGAEISHTDFSDKVQAGFTGNSFNASYDAAYGDTIRIYILAEDSLGYTHKRVCYTWYQPDANTQAESVFADGPAEVYDKNGKLLNGEIK